jgi:hypothetical protein
MPQGIPVSHCPGSNSHILVMSPEPSSNKGFASNSYCRYACFQTKLRVF